ncbi:hypothetical protein HY522_05950 [bacterium]|nr:hypothetical protein [bacterium]
MRNPLFRLILTIWGSAAGLMFTGSAAADSNAIQAVLGREYLPAVLEMIGAAKNSVRIIQYEYVSYGAVRRIEDAILAAARRGVDVRVLIDDTVRASRRNVERLAEKGIAIKLDETREYGEPGDKTTHAKMIWVDDQRFIVGSTNFSDKSISDNNEANVCLADPAAAKQVRAYFDRLWKNAADEPDLEPFRSAEADVLFNRQYLRAVKRLFQTAQTRIYVVLYGINVGPPGSAARDLIGEMERAKKRGVDVKVLLDKSGGTFAEKTLKFNREAQVYMEKAGIAVKFDSDEVITHAKVLVVDGAAVVGGTNWGHGPLNLYNDINVVVRRPEAVARYAEAFLALWSGARRF